MYVAVAEDDRRRARPARRHDPERHPEGVPGAEGVHLPAAPVDAARHRRHAVRDRRDAALAPGLDLRLPHPRGGLDGRAGAGLHARQRLRLRRGGPAPPASTSTSSRRGCRFFFNAHIDFFEEIGKYRAARRIWARWLRDRYGAQRRALAALRFHTQTAGVSLTAQQPEVNIARVAIQALAGCSAAPRACTPTPTTRRSRSRPRRRRASRCAPSRSSPTRPGVGHVADPLGGSHFVEWMTDEMERQAEAIFAHLDELGRRLDARGRLRRRSRRLVPGPRSPTPPTTSSASSTTGRRIVVGVNAFTDGDDGERPIALHRSRRPRRRQRKRLAEVKQARDDRRRRRRRSRGRARRRRPHRQPHARDPRRRARRTPPRARSSPRSQADVRHLGRDRPIV